LGAQERRALEGSARLLPQPLNLLAAPERMGGKGDLGENLAKIHPRTRRPRAHHVGGNFRRRLLRPGEKRGACVGKTKRGKGTKWMVVVDGKGVPLGVHLDSASPHESTLIEKMLDRIVLKDKNGRPRMPRRIVYDLAGDSDPLRERLAARGTEWIAPYRSNRTITKHYDGRKLRRYRRRWKVERTFAWLGNFRRLLVRYENQIKMYRAFFHVACLMIAMRGF
jgi:transposase